jgi:hypothetical protein
MEYPHRQNLQCERGLQRTSAECADRATRVGPGGGYLSMCIGRWARAGLEREEEQGTQNNTSGPLRRSVRNWS